MHEPSFLTTKKSRVEMLPLIDVMFLLVAFFMVAIISMVEQQGINVDLAKSESSKELLSDSEDSVVTVTATGNYFLNKEEFTEQNLPDALAKLFSANPKRVIFLNADKNAIHQDVMTALDIVRKTGFINVTFTVETK